MNKPFALWEPPEDGPQELIPGLLLRHGAFLLYGGKELGKTTILFEISHTLLTGEPLWGKLAPTMPVAQTYYIMGEHHKETIKEQWRMMFPEGKANAWGVSARGQHLVRGTLRPQVVTELATLVKGSGAVLFDPLGAFVDAEGGENDPTSMRSCVNAMIDVAGEGVALIAHHEGKPVFDQRGGRFVHSSTPRGASSIADAAAVVWRMTKESDRDDEHPNLYRLTREFYKGTAPSYYILNRNPDTLRHTLIRVGSTRKQVYGTGTKG